MLTTLALLTATTFADDGAVDGVDGFESDAPVLEIPDGDEPHIDDVVGGTQAAQGTWPDTAGIVFYSSYVGCTGTLIAPDVVVTAGHCVGGISHVLLGSNDWYTDQGEIIGVRAVYEYPNSQGTYDAAVLVLDSEASVPHRTIASDCILDDYLEDGVDVAVVGYGAIDQAGQRQTSKLMEGVTQVQDADGNQAYVDGMYSGFNGSVSPGGEIGAGGNGVDACFGDSGGPLYLLTEQGDYLVGITSRAYAGVPWSSPCAHGGVYVRPDALMDWMEAKTGRTFDRPACNAAPEPSADPIFVGTNDVGSTTVDANDPDPENTHDYVIVEGPEHGSAEIDEDGNVTYEPDFGFVGEDRITVAVTDDGSPYEASGPITSEIDIDVTVVPGISGSSSDDGEAELVGQQCGCSSSPVGGVLGTAWLFGLLAFARRR